MSTVEEVLAELRSKGSEKTRITYSRHGNAFDKTMGVSVADMKLIAKSIKGKQELACDLYESGYVEAMYLAGMVANGAKMSRDQLNGWALGAVEMPMVSEYTVPWVAVENTQGRELANEWIKSDLEHVACAGWSTYAGLVTIKPDSDLDLDEIEGLLKSITAEIHSAQNRVRYNMNGFVISVGAYVQPLLAQAQKAAQEIGVVSVSMGDTACKVRLASETIAGMEASGKVGVKRKMIRC